MKFKTIFLIFASLLVIDLSLTFFALNFLTGIEEANPLASFFFSNFGLLGYVFVLFLGILFLFSYAKLLDNLPLLMKMIKRITREKTRENEKDINKIKIFGFTFWLLLEFYVIINNIFMISKFL